MAMRASFTGKQITQALLQKGFREANTHHKYLFLYIDGKKTAIRTHVSHGKTVYQGDLWAAFRRQVGLQGLPDSCDNLVNCTLDGDGYVELLRQQNMI